jgi:hypothetical protein
LSGWSEMGIFGGLEIVSAGEVEKGWFRSKP